MRDVTFTSEEIIEFLDRADRYAKEHSTCTKVRVGSVIVNERKSDISYGCNNGMSNCTLNGCRRVKLYGENSKAHRLPSDCDAIHSEIEAICNLSGMSGVTGELSIFVTRYPCEACARAIAAAGIKNIVYGRRENMSGYSEDILKAKGCRVYHVDWDREDNTN